MTSTNLKEIILNAVTHKYLSSFNFNGLTGRDLLREVNLPKRGIKATTKALVQEGHVCLNFDINPHIKRLDFLRVEEQIKRMASSKTEDLLLYPSEAHLKEVVNIADYAGQPFSLRLALGQPQLSYISFDLRVLEFYRNDPRYYYTNNDISGQIVSTENLVGRDDVLLESFSFSYDEHHNRAVAVFLRYLTGLSPEHQQIWNANILGNEYKLHPAYYAASIHGEWYTGNTIFAAFLEELHIVNELCNLMQKPPLFRREYKDEARPQGFSFLIRPTLREFNEFVLLLDKMLSENLDKDFFRGDENISLEEKITRKDGDIIVTQKGTIQLLDEWIRSNFKTTHEETTQAIKAMIDAFKKVRKLRQDPAHAIRENEFNQEFFHRQQELMKEAYVAIMTLRDLFHLHPNARRYKIPNWLLSGEIWTE
jgi:hypothetical protein